MKKIISLFLSVIFAVSTFCAADVSAYADTNSVTCAGYYNYDYAVEVLDIVNNEREKQGLSKLTLSEKLTEAAMMRAAELVVSFSHTKPNGDDCFTSFDFTGAGGENIAQYYATPESVMNGWMNSAGHRGNILSSGFAQIGIGCFTTARGNLFWVQVFSGGNAESVYRPNGKQDVVADVSLTSGVETTIKRVDHLFEGGVCSCCRATRVNEIPELPLNQVITIPVSTQSQYVFRKFTPAANETYVIQGYDKDTSVFVYDTDMNLVIGQCALNNDGFIYNKYDDLQPGKTYIFSFEWYNKNIKNLSVKMEIEHKHNFDTSVNIPANATKKTDGADKLVCSACGEEEITSTYSYPKTIELSNTSFTYDGKVKHPALAVYDSNGRRINSSYYKVSYSKGCKNVGKYKVTVTFNKKYSGTLTKQFTIKPPKTTIGKVTAKSKGFNVKWSKKTAQVKGYEIQYSTSSNFKSAKTVTISKNKTTSKTIKKLKAKKKYYIRIRTYYTVGGEKYYSGWSSAKKITTKK